MIFKNQDFRIASLETEKKYHMKIKKFLKIIDKVTVKVGEHDQTHYHCK